jgi:exosortase/archaeosortase family protein
MTTRSVTECEERRMNTLLLQGRRLRRTLHWASRIESLSPAVWLTLQCAALWPSWLWAAGRVADGSDEPLGLVAMALLVVASASGRIDTRRDARPPWLAAALGLTVAATIGLHALPPLAVALLSVLALTAAFAAFRADRSPWLPVAGLLVLTLPLIASAQFYAGWPLRVVTAEASRWLLSLAGLDTARVGAVLVVGGREVLVDAPCSGVQLAWLGYAAACASAIWHRLGDARFAARLPIVGMTVLAANVLRNTVLVWLEGSRNAAPTWLHEAIGVIALAGVTLAVTRLMTRGASRCA